MNVSKKSVKDLILITKKPSNRESDGFKKTNWLMVALHCEIQVNLI